MRYKLKNLFLSLLCAVFCFGVTACKEKDPEKIAPMVTAYVATQEYYVGDKLSDIDISLTEGSTAGTISWVNPDTTLVLGENQCAWKFVPTETTKFKEKTGTIKIEAVIKKQNPTVNAVIESEVVYAETKLSTVEIALSSGDTEGTIEWVSPDTDLVVGEQQCSWKFVPTDVVNYNELVGEIAVDAVAQSVAKIEIVTSQTKTNYKAFETFDSTGLVLRATYDGGKVELVEENYTVSYKSGNTLLAGDKKVTITYANKTCEASVNVDKIEIAVPEIQGTYTFTGLEQTIALKPNGNESLYNVTNNKYTNAGEHQVKASLKDYDNYKWVGTSGQTVSLSFVMERADLVVVESNYTGIYDKEAHTSNVSCNFASKIYYFNEELTDQNFAIGSTTKPSYIDAGTYTIYYYIVGDSNHNNAKGELVVQINKAVPTVSTKYAYSLDGGRAITVPLSYASVKGLNDEVLDTTDKIEFVYYTNYTDQTTNKPTTSAQGATTNGGAPKSSGVYVVVTKYLGNKNYTEAITTSTLYIDGSDFVLVAGFEERPFAWLSESKDAYIEPARKDTGDLIEIVADCKFDGEVVEGIITRHEDGTYYFVTDKTYEISVSEDQTAIDLLNSDGSVYKTLNQWVIPYSLGVYECDTSQGLYQPSTMTIYNDYGTIKFKFVYYYVSTVNNVPVQTTGSKEGWVRYYEQSYLLSFCYDEDMREQYTRCTGIYDDEPVPSLNLSSVNPTIIRGVYTRVQEN